MFASGLVQKINVATDYKIDFMPTKFLNWKIGKFMYLLLDVKRKTRNEKEQEGRGEVPHGRERQSESVRKR